jgi:hypothetical protein
MGETEGQGADRKERKKGGGGGHHRRTKKEMAKGARKIGGREPKEIWAKGRKKTRRKNTWKNR